MKYIIEYYITSYKYITRELSDEQAFKDAKTAFYSQKGHSVRWEDFEGKDIIIPMDKVLLVRCYEEGE